MYTVYVQYSLCYINNQEMYWRIPKTLSPNQLIKTARQLTEEDEDGIYIN